MHSNAALVTQPLPGKSYYSGIPPSAHPKNALQRRKIAVATGI